MLKVQSQLSDTPIYVYRFAEKNEQEQIPWVKEIKAI